MQFVQFPSITPYTQRLKNSYVYWSVSSRARKFYVRTSHLSVLVKKKYMQIYILCNSFCLLSACSLRCKRSKQKEDRNYLKFSGPSPNPKTITRRPASFFWLIVGPYSLMLQGFAQKYFKMGLPIGSWYQLLERYKTYIHTLLNLDIHKQIPLNRNAYN